MAQRHMRPLARAASACPIAVILAATLAPAGPSNGPDGPAATCVLGEVRYRVDRDGSKAKRFTDYVYAIHSDDDRLDPLRVISRFNSFPAKVERIDVTIWNRNGTRHKRKKSDFRPMPLDPDGIFMTDRVYLELELGDLRPGDTLRIRSETVLEPFMGFAPYTFAAGRFPVRRSVYEVSIPRSLDPRFRTWNGAGEPTARDAGEEVVWRWEIEDLKRPAHETLGPEEPDLLPTVSIGVNRIAWGRADTWEGIAEAYWEQVRNRIQPVPVDRLPARTAPPDSPADRALERVQNNVRYVAIHLGEGGFIPHATEETLKNKYGDCKDMAALLMALPEMQDASPAMALVQTRRAGAGDGIDPLPTLNFFNHAVACVPSEAGPVWLDATAKYGTAANPRYDIQGAAALVVSGPHVGYRRIGPNPPESNRAIRVFEFKEHEVGRWTLDLRFEWTGSIAQYLWMSHSSGSSWLKILSHELEDLECPVKEKITEESLNVDAASSDLIRMTASLGIENPLDRGPGEYRPCWEREPFPLSVFSTPERKTDVHWPLLQVVSDTLIVASERLESVVLPDTSWSYRDEGLEFRARVAAHEGIATFTRTFVISSLIFPAERWADAREARGRMLRWTSRKLGSGD